nr:MAG TPA: hypothetical protein [Caudoviricetes sp.]DAX77929.1 MAG TPA: hypothetical protein [Caudoviricetes sp.]
MPIAKGIGIAMGYNLRLIYLYPIKKGDYSC